MSSEVRDIGHLHDQWEGVMGVDTDIHTCAILKLDLRLRHTLGDMSSHQSLLDMHSARPPIR